MAMEEFCRGRGMAVDEWISEIGGGLNFKRKKFLKLMRQIRLGEVETLVVADNQQPLTTNQLESFFKQGF